MSFGIAIRMAPLIDGSFEHVKIREVRDRKRGDCARICVKRRKGDERKEEHS